MFISILADSKRHDYLAEKLREDSHNVTVYKSYNELPLRIASDIAVLPIPTFRGNALNLNDAPENINREEFFRRFDSDCFIISCNCEIPNRKFTDINNFEPFVSKNAIPSAEGALSIAMNNSDRTLFGSNSLVIGHGRIGKILADRLYCLKSNVTVVARKPKDRFEAILKGMNAIDYSSVKSALKNADFIFQTVPFPVLNKAELDCVTKGIIIEISSKGIGTDMEYAEKNGKKFIYAPGIPEKYSSLTAGKILYDSVKDIIREIKLISAQIEEFT